MTNFFKKNHVSARGFTLIEAVVSLAIFTLSLTAIIGSFVAVLRLDDKARAFRVVEQNARFISEYLTREIRNGTINYDSPPLNYPSNTASQPMASDLRLINGAGERVRMYLSGTTLMLEKNGVGTTSLSGQDVRISNLRFYVYPSQNPYGSGAVAAHPRVTFAFTIDSNITTRATDQARATIQSTVSSREFPE